MIAQTPPMGWNSWDCYGAAVDEPTVRQNAAYMAEHLQVFGWEYVVVDIQWYQPTATSHAYEPFAELTMDEYGRLQPAPGRFPSSAGGKGFKPLADYVHSLGLKFGIHIMRGMPRMAAHRHLPILGCGKGCHEIANPNSICAWNPDMYGLRCDMPEARTMTASFACTPNGAWISSSATTSRANIRTASGKSRSFPTPAAPAGGTLCCLCRPALRRWNRRSI